MEQKTSKEEPNNSSSELDPFNIKKRTVYEVHGWQWLIFWPLALGIHLWYRTWRIELDDNARQLLQETPSPRMLVIWHNRSFVIPEVLRRFFDPSNIDCLISASKAAAWESAFFKTVKLSSIRGSSTRRSVQAVREMIKAVDAGRDLCVSPDGPSGPIYQVKKGAFAIAAKTKIPLLFISINAPCSFRLNSWDKHLFPLPFAKLTVSLRKDNLESRSLNSDDDYQRLASDYLEITQDPFHINPYES